jgi:hypothetical protein
MQAVMETSFDIVYLSTAAILGVWMLRRAKGRRDALLFGVMALVLAGGDAFHLIPRAMALCTDGLAAHTAALGFGKLVTSVTMTVFYVLLYRAGLARWNLRREGLTRWVYGLAAARIALCCFPQNGWFSARPPLLWGVLRNIPFTVLGVVLVVFYFRNTRRDRPLKHLWLAVVVSFGCYLPVVLLADQYPAVGALMIPKTCAYVWAVALCVKAVKTPYSAA